MKLRVYLSEQTMIDAHAEASKRHQVSRLAGITNQVISDGNPITADFVGLLGEIGFSILFNNSERDSDVYARSGSIDFTINGYNVEIKSSKHKNAHLLVPAYEIPEWAGGGFGVKEYNHIYALMIVDIDNRYVTFAGWTTRDKLIIPACLQNFRGGSRQSFVMCQEDLYQLDDQTHHWLEVMAKCKGHKVELTEA